MVEDTIVAIALAGALTGGVLNTIRAKLESDTQYSYKKLIGALIASSLTSLALVNIVQLPEQLGTLGTLGLFITNALLAVGATMVFSKTHKTTSS